MEKEASKIPDFTIPTRPWVALLLGAVNTGLAFIVGAKVADSGLSPVVVFYLACLLAVMGWVLLHIVPMNASAPAANPGSPRGPVGPMPTAPKVPDAAPATNGPASVPGAPAEPPAAVPPVVPLPS